MKLVLLSTSAPKKPAKSGQELTAVLLTPASPPVQTKVLKALSDKLAARGHAGSVSQDLAYVSRGPLKTLVEDLKALGWSKEWTRKGWGTATKFMSRADGTWILSAMRVGKANYVHVEGASAIPNPLTQILPGIKPDLDSVDISEALAPMDKDDAIAKLEAAGYARVGKGARYKKDGIVVEVVSAKKGCGLYIIAPSQKGFALPKGPSGPNVPAQKLSPTAKVVQGSLDALTPEAAKERQKAAKQRSRDIMNKRIAMTRRNSANRKSM